MLLANFNGKEHLRHRAVSLRQHGFLVYILTVFDIYSLYFYFNVYLLYVAHVSYIIKRIWYGMVNMFHVGRTENITSHPIGC